MDQRLNHASERIRALSDRSLSLRGMFNRSSAIDRLLSPRSSSSGSTRLNRAAGQPLVGEDWLYQLQLQKDSIEQISATSFDIVTIDYSQDGSDAKRYTPADLDLLHDSGKTALAYLSIGEAESYRYYFDKDWVSRDPETRLKQPDEDAPDWLGHMNKQWRGNYKVKYWQKEWQATVFGYLDKIIDAGFDGVYLDIVDGFEYWSKQNKLDSTTLKKSVAAERMIRFVERISDYARINRGLENFYIVPQNAENLLDYDKTGSYLQTISGIGVEDLFYDETTPQPKREINYRLKFLDRIVEVDKPVLSVDYVDTNSNSNSVYTGKNLDRIHLFRDRAIDEGFIPYVAKQDRELNEIVTISNIQP